MEGLFSLQIVTAKPCDTNGLSGERRRSKAKKFRRKAFPMSNQSVSKIDRMVRQLWVTLQTHQKMEEFVKHSFEHHPVISSSFVRFLTDHLASGRSSGGGGTTYDDSALRELLEETRRNCADQFAELSSELRNVKNQFSLVTRHHPELLKPKKKVP